MNAQSDPQLLRAFAEGRSEAAFAELVRRYIDLVHSAAFRMVNDLHLAKDVSQSVFVALAKDAGKLADHPVLSGWLHRTARNIAAQTVRTDVRRRGREQEAAAINEHPEADASWEQIAPHLDAALAELSATDRDAILLRYFENKPAQEMAAILGISAEAAQKRVSRAVERLRETFTKRGITTGAAGLAGSISANAVQTAPSGIATTLSVTAISGMAAATAISTLQKSLAVAAIAIVAGAGIYHFTRGAKLEAGTSLEGPLAIKPRKSRSGAGNSLIEKIARARAEMPPIDRQKELVRLKEQWMEFGKKVNRAGGGLSTNELNVEHAALCGESVKLLQCSRETIQLIEFLEEHSVYNNIDGYVEQMLGSSNSVEARSLLVELPDKPGGPREDWSDDAGRGCPKEEFEEFHAALMCKRCAQEALFGQNQALMQTDPATAIQSTVQALEADEPSMYSSYGLQRLFDRDLPADLDFGALEKRLPNRMVNPAASKDDHPVDWLLAGRDSLFKKWAQADPVAASNYVLENPERCPPSLIGTISNQISNLSDPPSALSWLKRFPEGSYFDEAARVAASYLAMPHPDEARQLIARIGNPQLREMGTRNLEKQQAILRDGREY